MEALALVAVAVGDAKRAARLWGAACGWREAINEPLPRAMRGTMLPRFPWARSQLGEDVYAAAWSEGHAMSAEQAIALAFEE